MDTTWSSAAARNTAPAVAPICDILKDTPKTNRPRLIIHSLSAGSCSLHSLYNHFLQLDHDGNETSVNTNRKELCLPSHVTIFDSSPSVWSYKFNMDIMTASAKSGWMKLLILPIAHLMASTCWFLIHVVGVPDPNSIWSAAHKR